MHFYIITLAICYINMLYYIRRSWYHIQGGKFMKIYEPLKLEIVDFLESDVLTASGEAENTSGVYEHVSDLSAKSDWF